MIAPAVWAGAAATAAVAGTWAARRRHQWRVNQVHPRQYQALVDGLRHTPQTPKVLLDQPGKAASGLRQQSRQQWAQVQQFMQKRARYDGRQVAFEGAQAWFKDYRPGGYRDIEAHGTPAIRLGGQGGPSYRVFGLERDGRVLGQVVTTVDDRDQITRVVGYQWQNDQTPPTFKLTDARSFRNWLAGRNVGRLGHGSFTRVSDKHAKGMDDLLAGRVPSGTYQYTPPAQPGAFTDESET